MPRSHAVPGRAARRRLIPPPTASPRVPRSLHPNRGRRTDAGRSVLSRPWTPARRRSPARPLPDPPAPKPTRPTGPAQPSVRPLAAIRIRRLPNRAPQCFPLPLGPGPDRPRRMAGPTPWSPLLRVPRRCPGSAHPSQTSSAIRPIPFSVGLLLSHAVRRRGCRRSQAVPPLRAFSRWREARRPLNGPDFAPPGQPGRHRPGWSRPRPACRPGGAIHAAPAARSAHQSPAPTPLACLPRAPNPEFPSRTARPQYLPERPWTRTGFPASMLPAPARAFHSPSDPTARPHPACPSRQPRPVCLPDATRLPFACRASIPLCPVRGVHSPSGFAAPPCPAPDSFPAANLPGRIGFAGHREIALSPSWSPASGSHSTARRRQAHRRTPAGSDRWLLRLR